MGGCEVGADFIKLYVKPDEDPKEPVDGEPCPTIDPDLCCVLGYWSQSAACAGKAQRRNSANRFL
jgi:hypothetical protein